IVVLDFVRQLQNFLRQFISLLLARARGKEIRALRQLRRENLQSRYVFNTERGGPVTRAWFLKRVCRTGELAKLPFPAHPHMLRHACGFKLANDGVDTRALQHYLGHRNIMHTVRYTELRSDRFCCTRSS